MKTRHFFSEELMLPREKSRDDGNIVQMKVCGEKIISKVPTSTLFNGFTVKEVEDLICELNIRVRQYNEREMVIHECNPAVDIVVVLSGTLLVYECGLAEDSRHLVQRLYKNDAFGTMLPVLGLKEYPGMLIAEKLSEVMLLSVEGVRRLLAKGTQPKLLTNLYALVSQQGYYAWRKLMLLSCYEISDRILLYLKWRKDDGLPAEVPFKYAEFASYLGVNRTALYRAIDKLRVAKKIVVTSSTIRLA